MQSDTLMPNIRTPKHIIVLISQIATTGPFVITISDFIAISASRKHHETSWKKKSHQPVWKVAMKCLFSRHSADVSRELHIPSHKKLT